MISKNFKILLALIFAALIFSPLKGEDKIDIWKNKKNNGNIDSNQSNTVNKKDDIKPNLAEPVEANQDILITDGAIDNSKEIKVFGVYDPADYNFNLNMWSTTKAEDVRSSIKRIKKINLSKTSNEILENILLSFSYPPEGMEEKEFINLKINWLIENNRLNLLEEFLKQNKEFEGKSKAVHFLLGITEKTSNKINEKNLLNFYLSSVTVKDFNYQPTKKTKKEIWKYLNAANLIKLEDITDKDKIKELEVAANQKQIDRSIIFDIYKQVTFNLNTLINAKNIYQSLESVDARSLLYQKFLLSENNEAKIEYLFLLEELFKKDEIENIYSEFLSDNLKKIGLDNVPEQYKEIVENKLLKNTELQLGKVKYNDKILHQSKIIKFYVENEEGKKIQKEIDKTFKKINKNKKYFYSAKDLALAQSLVKDGFSIPENFNLSELATKYEVPKNLLQLIDKNQNAFLALKIVEIIGEDEPYQLDPETIYFITSLLNQMDLITIRNKVLISALPQRV